MNPRILIVDDEEAIRFTFKSFMSKEGYEVVTAKDYTSAIEIISGTELDVMFVDIVLGDHTGIEILREVKARGLHCPVVMITGEPNVDTATDAVRMGAFDYMPKPIRKETLLRVTHNALQHKALLDERDRIEAEKERYRRNLEAIFRSVGDAIVTVDDGMCVIEANEATGGICGFSPRDAIGEDFSGVQDRCNRSCRKVLAETLKTRNTVKEYRVECRRQEHPNQVVLLSSSPLTDVDNRFMGAVLVVRDITRLTNLERELRERHQFHHIIGKSAKMQEMYRLVEDLADAETTVLITGESGTGKELVARALHYGGLRGSKTLVNVNCSALTENLLESELFGHVKGAFTGAVKDKTGRFQMADEGTIFLDEIGDISPRIQLKLLRVLQEREFERVGDSRPMKVDVRIIAATNRDLRAKVRLGEFREDVYYRLKVVEIGLPPLRDRRDDIPLLAGHFLQVFGKRFNKGIDGVSEEVMNTFMRYPWPGNVRELEHAMEHAFALCHGRTIMVDHLPTEIKGYFEVKGHGPETKVIDEPRKILKALNKADWNKAKAARILGISRQTIYRKIEEYKLIEPDEKV